MANVATVATAAVIRRGVPRGHVTPHAMIRAMTHFHGRSYCVPTWGYDDYPEGRIYAQHGEKWSPTGVFRAWERYGRYLETVWVRWYDSGGDHDTIFAYAADGYGASELCRYAFDRVRVRGATTLGRHLAEGEWRPDGLGDWSADVSGSYLAANDRGDLPADQPTLPSRTTPVRGQLLARGTLRWAADDVLPTLTQLEAIVLAAAESVEFHWRGRVTRVYQRRGDRWWNWCIDDWDNCVAPGWIAEQARRGGARSSQGRSPGANKYNVL